MLEILRKQANEEIHKHPSYIDRHHQLTNDKQLRSFYMKVIVRNISSYEQMLKVVQDINKSKSIKWELFLGCIWTISLNIQHNSHQMLQLGHLISQISIRNLVDINTLLLQLSDDLIYISGLMEQKSHEKKLQRTFTKLNYDQNKYTLLRENNQGFAKISLLLISINTNSDRQTIWDRIISLIGNYDLDPDRVLDLILEAYIQKPNLELLNFMISQFNKKSICPLLGQRLVKMVPENVSNQLVYAGTVQNLSNVTIEQLSKQLPFMTDPNLIRVIAELIKCEMIDLNQIIVYLKPNDDIINKVGQKKIDAGKQKVMKAFVMLLQEIDIKEKQKQVEEDHMTFMGQMLYSTKFALMSQLVRINDWGNFLKIYESLPKLFDLLLYQPLLNNLCDLLEWMIDPVYNKISYSVYFQFQRPTCKQFRVENVRTQQMKQFFSIGKQFFDAIINILGIVGPYIGFRSTTFIKLCRLLKKMIKQPEQISDGSAIDSYEIIGEIAKEYLLPGINCQVNNPSISIQFFELYELYDYKFRYDGYLSIYKARMTENPYVCKIFENVKNKTNIIVNNLSKDNKKIFFKKMAKITHDQSLQVFYWIVRRLMREDYQTVVPQIVGAMANCTPLSLQMAMFVFIYALAQQKQPTVDCKSGECKAWYKNVITFIGLFYRKYLETDIQPVFDYIVLKLEESIRDVEDSGQLPGSLLNLLQGLLNKMFGNFMMPEVNKSKYEILAAGPRLQFQALYLTSQIRAAKKSKMILQNFFWEKTINFSEGVSLAFHLMVLLAQKKAEFMHRTFIGDLKIIGDIYDSYSELLIQLIRFLSYQSADHTHYAKLLPQNPFNRLLNGHKLAIQIAFQIWRPSLKSMASMSNEQWNQTIQIIKKAMEASYKQRHLIEGKNYGNKLKTYLSLWKEKFETHIPYTFFGAFWLMTLDSIYYPKAIYTQKIDQQRKKVQQNLPSKKGVPQRQLEKAKTLYEKLVREDQLQKKKYMQTINEKNLNKLQLEIFKNPNPDKTLSNLAFTNFAESLVQMCIIPRLLLEASEALYCVKFIVELIKVNKLSSSKSIKLISYIIELVVNYLPFSTQKQASNCLAVFVSEMMGMFQNWSDSTKLKQDLKKYLNIEENLQKDNYSKIRDSILKLYEKVGNLLKSIKQQPYIIKNCLYFLEKLQCIPGYRQQAEQLQNHLKDLKQLHLTVDMKTILERQISMITSKRPLLTDKPQIKKTNGKMENQSKSPDRIADVKVTPIHERLLKGGIKNQPYVQRIEVEAELSGEVRPEEMNRPTGIRTVKELREEQLKEVKKMDQPRKDLNESNTQLYVRKDIGVSQKPGKSQLEELKERRVFILQQLKTNKNNVNGQTQRIHQQVPQRSSRTGLSGIEIGLAVEVSEGRPRQKTGKQRETQVGEIQSGQELGIDRIHHREEQYQRRHQRSREKKSTREMEGQQRQRKGSQRHNKRYQGYGYKEGSKKLAQVEQQEIGQIREERQNH